MVHESRRPEFHGGGPDPGREARGDAAESRDAAEPEGGRYGRPLTYAQTVSPYRAWNSSSACARESVRKVSRCAHRPSAAWKTS